MSAFSRELPKQVQQYKDGRFTCWAAALESWMSVTPQSPASWFIKTQDDAIAEWKSFSGSNSGLDVQWGFRLMAAAVGMEYGVFKPAKKISGGFLYDKLKTRGHIYVLYAGGMTNTSGQFGHCVVVYGISNLWSDSCKVSFMDPWTANYKDEPLTYFQQAGEAVAGWFDYTA
ncbi:MAG: hypothetical protein M3033_01390 [Acidobacteriota bacterium]|nr:hypothetical protein [Acidobacteriota bacterium]